MQKDTVRFIAVNAIIAAMYAALTAAIAPLSYGNIQFRFSEILIFLVFYDIRFMPGLILGCFIANFFSTLPMPFLDVIFGTLATTIALVGIRLVCRFVKNRNVARFTVPVIGAVSNGFLVALTLHIALQLPYWLSVIEVAAGEFAVLLVGAFLFIGIEKIPAVRRHLTWNWSR